MDLHSTPARPPAASGSGQSVRQGAGDPAAGWECGAGAATVGAGRAIDGGVDSGEARARLGLVVDWRETDEARCWWWWWRWRWR